MDRHGESNSRVTANTNLYQSKQNSTYVNIVVYWLIKFRIAIIRWQHNAIKHVSTTNSRFLQLCKRA